MSAGPVGPGDPTMPAHPAVGAPAAGPPAYAPPPDQRFERSGPYPPGYDPYAQGPGGGHDRAAEAAAFARRHLRTPETKEFFKTSEFMIWALTAVLLGIAAATSDALDGGRMWGYLAAVSAAYILSRGLAKAGTSRGNPENHRGHDHDR